MDEEDNIEPHQQPSQSSQNQEPEIRTRVFFKSNFKKKEPVIEDK